MIAITSTLLLVTKTMRKMAAPWGTQVACRRAHGPYECGFKWPYGDAAKRNCPRYPAMDEFNSGRDCQMCETVGVSIL